MAAEQPLPYDLHDSNDLGCFTHVAPSTLTDSEHEVIIEVDSDSDVPSLKARKDRSTASLPVNGRKKGLIGKKKPLPSGPHTNPLMSEDLLYHLMDQNKILMNQNKVLTQRLEPSDPFAGAFPRDDYPVIHEPPPIPEVLHPLNVQPCPEPFPPDFAQPVKRKSKEAAEDKLYAQCKELWDVLPRILRVLKAAAPLPTPNVTAVKTNPSDTPECDDVFANMTLTQCFLPYDPRASSEERMLALSKVALLDQLADVEWNYGVNQNSKKFGKKAKPKTDNGKLKFLDRDDLMPWVRKGLGVLQKFLLVFVIVQLSLVGGDVFHFFKKTPKNSSWLGF
ncbi:hypothetical protein MBLNU13_g10575t1 [Cladosporium sp. NU13]